MKNFLYLITLFFIQVSMSQIIITPNPFSINSGTITITYGSAGNYSLFDPISDPNLYIYTGLETDGVTATWDYHDVWTNITTLTPLTWDSAANAYVATLNIGTRNYFSEATSAITSLPTGTTANNWFFIIRNLDGTRQSVDLFGANFGFVPGILQTDLFLSSNEVIISNGKIQSEYLETLQVEIFGIDGKIIEKFNLEAQTTKNLNLLTKGIYLAKISNKNQFKTIKFIY